MGFTRKHILGVCSLCSTTFAFVIWYGVLKFLQVLPPTFELGLSKPLVILGNAISMVIAILMAIGIWEPILDWWCAKPKKLHQTIIVVSVSAAVTPMLGWSAIVSLHPNPPVNGK